MPAGKYDFTIEQGATFRRTLTWKDQDGNPINLTGASARLKAKKSNGVELFSLTDTDGITLGGTNGTIALYLSDEATAELDFDSARYDLEIVSPSGEVTRLVRGTVTLQPEETR